MLKFLVRRLTLGVAVMWVVATAVFILYFIAPHDVARTLAGKQSTERVIQLIRHRLGLDKPITEQYLDYLNRLLHGDLGYSYVNSMPVVNVIKEDLPITASVAFGGAILWLLIGVSAGVLAATRPRSFLDRTVTAFALFFYSMPVFLLGQLFLLLLFFRLTMAGFDIFPGGGYVPFAASPGEWLRHLILPWFTVALVSASTYARLTRGSMLEVLGEDYIRTARSKGLRERRVIYRHGLRAGMSPVVTQFGIDLGTLLGGVILTETVFGLPGLGQQIVTSISDGDLPVIMGLVLLASGFIVLANIVVDALYAVLDPRVRLT
ncbi:MAG: ABC transporter permease subunit [Actinophytocola sp.]|nr:ABC transporter permease subunit [Actinophytocola sp.]